MKAVFINHIISEPTATASYYSSTELGSPVVYFYQETWKSSQRTWYVY